MKTINGHRALTLASLLGMLGAFAGCGAPTPGASTPDAGALAPTTRGTGMTVMLRVGPEGGTIALESVSLTVPPGALTSAQTLSVTSSMEAPPEGHAPYSPVFRFEPEGITFARPVAVRFTAGSGATDPVIYWTRPGSGEFEELGGVFEGGVVRGEVTHFSRGFAARRRAALADGGARDVPAALDAVPGDIPAPTDAPAEDVACTVAGTRYCGVGVGCVSIYNNDLHCGGCGNACVAGQYCAIADCVTRPADAAVPDAPGDGGGACPAPLSACGTDCRNLTSDRNHCGACGNVCPVMGPGLTTRCTDGLCGAQCGEFVRNCDGDLTNGCEVRVDADTANCGGCDVACASGQTCRLGACAGGDGGGVDAPSTDVGAVDARTDVGPTDAGSMDVRTADAGTLDAGTLDAGTADVRPIDAGTADSGPADSGPVDSGPVDSGRRMAPAAGRRRTAAAAPAWTSGATSTIVARAARAASRAAPTRPRTARGPCATARAGRTSPSATARPRRSARPTSAPATPTAGRAGPCARPACPASPARAAAPRAAPCAAGPAST